MRIYETPQSICHVGVARADITPPVGIYHRMWGAATHERAAGVHRPLQATVLVLDAKVIVSLDHCLLGAAEITLLRQTIFARTQTNAEDLLITFTHTHAAGLMSLDRAHLPGGELIEPYLRDLAEKCADLVSQAARDRQRAHGTYGYGRCSLAKNRDFWDEERQQFVCGFNPDEPADDTVVVARFTSAETGRCLATVVNYACHPTTLAWDNQLISPDYIGALRELVEPEIAGTDSLAPCIFLQGASAELGPRDGFVGDPAVADRNGRQLGYAALEALASLPPPATHYHYAGAVVSGATIGTWEHRPAGEGRNRTHNFRRQVLVLAYRSDRPNREQVASTLQEQTQCEQQALATGDEAAARDARALIERQTRMLRRLDELPPESYPYLIHVWRTGDAIWLGVQGELYSRLQTELRARFPKTPIIVITLVDGWGPSYVVPRETYGKGLYQESISVLAPGAFEQIIAECGTLIEELLESTP